MIRGRVGGPGRSGPGADRLRAILEVTQWGPLGWAGNGLWADRGDREGRSSKRDSMHEGLGVGKHKHSLPRASGNCSSVKAGKANLSWGEVRKSFQ